MLRKILVLCAVFLVPASLHGQVSQPEQLARIDDAVNQAKANVDER